MALQIRDLSVLGYANGFTLWHYRSSVDTLAQISGANYFGAAGDMLEANDLMIVVGTDGVRSARVASAVLGTVAIAHPAEEGRYLLQVSVPAMNAVSESFVVVPYAGIVTGIRASLDAATTATAVLTGRAAGAAMTGGALSLPASAAGAAFAAAPTAANSVAAGQTVSVACNGAGGSAARATVVFEITRL